jgi:response regulator RpfG family c-di-GMP phosphodiesterase
MSSAGAEVIPSEVEARILIVDDEAEITALLSEALQAADPSWRIETTNDAQDALRRLGEDEFDCLVTDLSMPALDGLGLAGQARRANDHLALIAITGYGSVQSSVEALRLGFADFLQKPFAPDALVHAVEHAVSERRRRDRVELRFAELAESNARLEAEEEQLNQKLQIASHDLVLSSKRMARQIEDVAAGATAARSLMGVVELEDLLGLCAELVGDRVACRSSVLALYETHDAGVGLMVRAHPDSDSPPALCWLRQPLVSGILCRAAQAQKSVHVEDIADSVLMDPMEKELWAEGRLLAVPVAFQGSTIAVAVLHRTPDADDFSAADVKAITELGRTMAPAILTAKVHHQQRCQIYSTLESIAEAAEAREPGLKGHASRVLAYAEQMIPAMELAQAQVGALQIASRLHDLGRIIIPDSVAQHTGPLSQQQWQIVRRHAEAGASFLKNLDFFGEIAEIVRAHHESYDGTGYPDMKAGDEIPLVSRMLAVADAFDAMTSSRAYREAMTIEDALDQLRQLAGQQFDPHLVDAFLAVQRDVLEDIQGRGR